MANLQQALDNIQERITPVTSSKIENLIKKEDTSADEDDKQFERMMLGLESVHKEPNFKKIKLN